MRRLPNRSLSERNSKRAQLRGVLELQWIVSEFFGVKSEKVSEKSIFPKKWKTVLSADSNASSLEERSRVLL